MKSYEIIGAYVIINTHLRVDYNNYEKNAYKVVPYISVSIVKTCVVNKWYSGQFKSISRPINVTMCQHMDFCPDTSR